MESHVNALQRALDQHPVTLNERIREAAARYRWA